MSLDSIIITTVLAGAPIAVLAWGRVIKHRETRARLCFEDAEAAWEDSTTWHASGDPFASAALCGAVAESEPDGHLRLHSIDHHVTCVDCRNRLIGGAS